MADLLQKDAMVKVVPLPDTENALRLESAEHRRTYELLRKSEAALRQAQRLGQTGSWEWEIATDITSWSEQLYVIFGLDSTHLPPTYADHGRLYTPGSWATLQSAVAQARSTGASYALDLEYVHAAGRTGWIHARGAAEHDESGRVVALHGTVQEVTELRKSALLDDIRHELEAEIAKNRQLETALAQAKKLEVLGLLSGGIAHDFNNVLAAISGSLHLLKRVVEGERPQMLVERGLQGAERATRLVRQLMGFARTQALEVRTVDLAQQLQSCVELLQLSAGQKVRVSIQAAEASMVLIDPSHLEVALINLTINARDAMPDGGELQISLDTRQKDRVAILLRDTGVGMAPDVLLRAREPFYTTKPLGQGTGLGLAMVGAFAQQCGGSLELDSVLGKGTCITLSLPRAAGSLVEPAEHEDGAIAWERHGDATILVVDDDPLVRPVVVQYLRDLRYTVVEAESGGQAIDMVRQSMPHLVVTDVAMPSMDGPTLASQLRLIHPALAILMITGHANRTLLAGEEVLDKPFTQARLAERVLRLLGRSSAEKLRLAGRIKHPALQAFYQNWHAQRGGAKLPTVRSLQVPTCMAPDHVFIGEVTGLDPFVIERTYVGKVLADLPGNALKGRVVSTNEERFFGGLEAAYRRCVRLREPSYEYMRFQLDDGSSALFERLLLPCADAATSTHQLVGMVMLQNLS
jgi:signal transduction histidine kinase